MTGPTTVYRKARLSRCLKKLISQLETDLMDDFLILLLNAMRLVLAIDSDYHRNIEDGDDIFNAIYVFKSNEGRMAITACFEPIRILFIKRQRLRVVRGASERFDVEVTFKNGKALWEFLLSKDPDVFEFIFNNKLQTRGNLNYLMKFGYMANHLKELTKLGAACA